MDSGDYLLGAAILALTIGSAVASSIRLERRYTPAATAVAMVLTWSIWITAFLFLVVLLPGIAGILSREAVAVVALTLVAAVYLLVPRPSEPRPEFTPVRLRMPADAHEWIAAVSAALAIVWAVAVVLALGRTPPVNVDALAFHLPGIGDWIQNGSVMGIEQFLFGIPTGQYPQTGDVLLSVWMMPWDNDAFIRLANLPFITVTLVAVFALARELGARTSTSVTYAALLFAVPAVHEPALDMVMTDPPLLAMLGCAAYFLAVWWRSGRREDLVLATIALGIAFGSKWYGVSSVVAVLSVWLIACCLSAVRRRGIARRAHLVAGGVLALGAIWLLRNLIDTGNPISPVEVAPFGVTVFDAPELPVLDQTFFSIAHYAGQPDIWADYFFPAFSETLALPALLLLIGLAAALFCLVRRSRADFDERVAAGLVLAITLVAVYAITPSSAFGPEGEPILTGANTRYVTPALLIAAPLGAWAATRLGGTGLVIEALVPAAIVHGLWEGYDGGLDGAVTAKYVAAACLVVAAIGTVAVLLWRQKSKVRALAVAALLAFLIAGGYVWQQRYNDGRYLGSEPAFDFVLDQADSDGYKIGLAGVADTNGLYPVWPFFGDRIENEVVMIARFEGDVALEFEEQEAFTQALLAEAPDFLAIGLGAPAQTSVEEERWAEEAGYSEVARSERVVLFSRLGVPAAQHGERLARLP